MNDYTWRNPKRMGQNTRFDRKTVLPRFFENPDVYEIKGYPGYYISATGQYGNWQLFRAPDVEPICEYENLAFEPDEEGGRFMFRKGVEYFEDYTIFNNITPREERMVADDNFIQAIYYTIRRGGMNESRRYRRMRKLNESGNYNPEEAQFILKHIGEWLYDDSIINDTQAILGSFGIDLNEFVVVAENALKRELHTDETSLDEIDSIIEPAISPLLKQAGLQLSDWYDLLTDNDEINEFYLGMVQEYCERMTIIISDYENEDY